MQELKYDEIDAVSGGLTTTGSGIALGGVAFGIASAVAGGPVGAMLGIGAVAFGGLSYAYEAYSSSVNKPPLKVRYN